MKRFFGGAQLPTENDPRRFTISLPGDSLLDRRLSGDPALWEAAPQGDAVFSACSIVNRVASCANSAGIVVGRHRLLFSPITFAADAKRDVGSSIGVGATRTASGPGGAIFTGAPKSHRSISRSSSESIVISVGLPLTIDDAVDTMEPPNISGEPTTDTSTRPAPIRLALA